MTCRLSSAGLGDMAVSNTIGSNVFDILVGLGVPWGLQTMVINYGSTVSSSRFLSEMTPCALQGVIVVLALCQPRAAGDALPPSPWHAGSHFVQRRPEQPGQCLQEAARVCPALTGALAPCLCPPARLSPPSSFPQMSRDLDPWPRAHREHPPVASR